MPEISALDLFNDVLEIDSNQARGDYLEQVCRGNRSLRLRIEALLAAHGSAGEFLSGHTTATGTLTGLSKNKSGGVSLVIGSRIGQYKIREKIGEGGMGAIYVADQTQPVKRRVALKLIREGLGSADIVGRFEAERQALAMMDHPNIARVLDGGTTDAGQPYFAMELVQGLPITAYCDQKQLTTSERLRLFLDVCHAVQHAHQRGIIHRDIKPSNVMVAEIDDRAIVKVIDFGIAKAVNEKLTDHSIYTQFSQLIGTPQYMSPEQAGLGVLDIDTRSDVYSLGALLYELLTGSTPIARESLDSAGYDEMRRIIREDEPRRPSAMIATLGLDAVSTVSERRSIGPVRLASSLKGELDWIVLKSLEKDRNRRYESPGSLADDIERQLRGDAVQACPPSVRYRLTKFTRRNKIALATISLVACVLLIGTGVSGWHSIRAAAAEEVANAHKENAEVNLEVALEAIEKLLAHVGNPELSKLPGIQDIRAQVLRDGLDFYERFKLTSGSSPNVDYRAARIYLEIGVLTQATTPDTQAVIDAYETGLTLVESLISRYPNQNTYRELAAEFNMSCADYYWFPKSIATAETDGQAILCFERAQEQFRHLALAEPGRKEYRVGQGYALSRMAGLRQIRSRDDPRVTELLQRALKLGYANYKLLAYDAKNRGDGGLELEYWEKAIAEYRAGSTKHAYSTAGWFLQAAEAIHRRDPVQSQWLRQASIERGYQRLQDFPAVRDYWSGLYGCSASYAKHLLQTLSPTEALATADKLVKTNPAFHVVRGRILQNWREVGPQREMLDAAVRRFPTQTEYLCVRAKLLQQQADWDAALADLDQVIILNQHHRSAYAQRAVVYRKLGQQQNAVEDFTTVLAMTGGSDQGNQLRNRAAAYFELELFSLALADLSNSLEQHPHTSSLLTWIAPSKVATCPSQDFREGLIGLADRFVELNSGSTEALVLRAVLRTEFGRVVPQEELRSIINAYGDAAYGTCQAALLALKMNDRSLYRQLCRDILKSSGHSQSPYAAYYGAWTAAIAPDSLVDYREAIALAKTAAVKHPDDPQVHIGLGAILVRSGQFDAAQEALERADELQGIAGLRSVYVSYFRAINLWREGDKTSATSELVKANVLADQELASSPKWNRRLTIELLKVEVNDLIQ